MVRTGLAVLYRFHVQEAWDWTQYAQDSHEFAVSTTVLTDESGQDNHGFVVGSSWKLKVLPDAFIVFFSLTALISVLCSSIPACAGRANGNSIPRRACS